jgi:hypothetical protein
VVSAVPAIGARVRMSDALRKRLRGHCGEAGRHLGPFDPEDADTCWGCSSAHVDEFGACEGTVIGPAFADGPDVDVRWWPSGLRYAYLPDELEVIEG